MPLSQKQLCTEGKRDEAQKKAIAFGNKMKNDPNLKVMQKCTENMKDMMPNMPYMDLDEEEDYSESHVCD